MLVRGARCWGATASWSIKYWVKLLGNIYLEIIHQRELSRGDRGKFQVVNVPIFKRALDSFSPDFGIYFQAIILGSVPLYSPPFIHTEHGKPFVLQTQGFRFIFSSFLTHGVHIYAIAIHTDNVIASFNFNSVLGITLRTFVICVLSSPSTLPNPSFWPRSFLFWLISSFFLGRLFIKYH